MTRHKTKEDILIEYIIETTIEKVRVHTQEIIKGMTGLIVVVPHFDLLLEGAWLKDVLRN